MPVNRAMTIYILLSIFTCFCARREESQGRASLWVRLEPAGHRVWVPGALWQGPHCLGVCATLAFSLRTPLQLT